MKISTTINKTRRHLAKHKKEWAIFFAGWVIGLILTPSTFDASATLFDSLSRHNLNRLCLLLLIAASVMVPWVLLLKDDIKRHQKYLKKYAPSDFNIDAEEEYDDAWDEAEKKEKQV